MPLHYRLTQSTIITATPDNLARLAEVLTAAYQDGLFQAKERQTINITFEAEDVTVYQMCEGREALAHSVLTGKKE